MKEDDTLKIKLCRAGGVLAAVFLATALAVAGEDGRDVFVLTSTNSTSGNNVVVFKLNRGADAFAIHGGHVADGW